MDYPMQQDIPIQYNFKTCTFRLAAHSASVKNKSTDSNDTLNILYLRSPSVKQGLSLVECVHSDCDLLC